MPRKTSFCNGALLRSDARRYWPLLFLYVAVWAMILPLPLLQADRWQSEPVRVQATLHNAIHDALYASIIMALIFGCLIAMAVWSYLMTPRSIGLMHALPVTRTQQFFSHTVCGFGMLTAGNLLVLLLSVICCAARGYVDWSMLGAWLLLTELMELLFFALASLCAMATGWLLAIPVLYGAVNIMAYLLYLVVQAMAELFYYGFTSSGPAAAVQWLTPVGRLWQSFSAGQDSWIDEYGRLVPVYGDSSVAAWKTLSASAYTTCILYAAAALAILALVWWLYQKRPSETAGDAMSFRWLRPIARWTIGLCGGWGLGLFLHYMVLSGRSNNLVQLLISQLIMGAICFFGAQMLLQKKFRIFNRRWWIETAALLAVLAAVTVCVKLDITGYQHRVPAESDIAHVRLTCRSIDLNVEDPAMAEKIVALHRAILDQYDRDGAEDVYPGSAGVTLEDVTNQETQYLYIRLRYTLDSGAQLSREYRVAMAAGTDVYRLLTDLANSRVGLMSVVGLDYVERQGGAEAIIGGYIDRYSDGAFLTLTGQQARELVERAYADIDSGAVTIDVLDQDKTFSSGGDSYGIALYLRDTSEDGRGTATLSMPLACTRMWEFVESLELEPPLTEGDAITYYD